MANKFFKIRQGISIQPGPTPTNPSNGDMCFDPTTNVNKMYQGGAWTAGGNGQATVAIAATTIDVSAGTVFYKTLTGNVDFTFTNIQSGKTIRLILTHDDNPSNPDDYTVTSSSVILKNDDINTGFIKVSRGRIYTISITFDITIGYAQKPIAKSSILGGSSFCTNGIINTMIVSGTSIYLGGQFSKVYTTPPINYFLGIDPTSATKIGEIIERFNGTVLAIVASGNSIYCGGGFTKYNNTTCLSMAKINIINGTPILDPTFNTVNGFNGNVYALVLDGSGNLYCGGSFTTYAGTARQRVAKINATNAILDTTFDSSSGFNNTLTSLVLDGSGLYCGGYFTTYGGTTRQRVAKLNLSTAVLDGTFDSSSGFDSDVQSMAIDSTGLYCGGQLSNYGGTVRQHVAKLNLTTAVLDGIFNSTSGFNGYLRVIILDSSGNLYCGGGFSTYGGVSRKAIAKLNSTTAVLDTTFIPSSSTSSDTYSFALNESTNSLYRGDDFGVTKISTITATVDPIFQNLFAETLSGVVPRVYAIALSNGILYCGGQFNQYGGFTRNSIAKLNIINGVPVFDSIFGANSIFGGNSIIYSMAFDGSTGLYIGGDFTTYNGMSRKYIVKVNSTTSAVDLTFDSSSAFDGAVNSVVLDGSGNLYCGGAFTHYGVTGTQRVAKLSASTAALDGTFISSSGFDANVNTLAVDGTGLYCGGAFTHYGATTRQRIAKLNLSSGAYISTFNTSSGFNDEVLSILLDGSGSLYCGGKFYTYKGNARLGVAKINATTAAVNATFDSYNGGARGFDDWVYSLALDGAGGLYCSGFFNVYGATLRQKIAKLNASTADLDLTFDSSSGCDYLVATVAFDGSNGLYCGGGFSFYASHFRTGIVKLNTSTAADASTMPIV